MHPDKQTKSGHDDFPIEIHGDLLFVPSHGFSDGPALQRAGRERFAKNLGSSEAYRRFGAT